MFKPLKSVSVLLLLFAMPAAISYAASENGATSVSVTQQNGTCKGVVKDKAGEAVIGASVVVKGTTNGVITDLDGNFVLSNVPDGATIQISYVGYTPQEVKFTGKPLDITLQEDTQTLDEVVEKADHRADQRGKQAVVPGASKKERKAQRRHDASEIQCRGFRLFLVDFLELRAKLRCAHGLGADFPAECVELLELYKVKRRGLPDAARLRQLHAVFKQDRQYNIGRDREDVDLLRAIGSSKPRHGVLHAVDLRAAKKQHLPHVQ